MVNQREVLYLTGGLVAGLLTGILVARSVFKAEYERRADEEIESVKERYRYIRKEGLDPAPEQRVGVEIAKTFIDELGYDDRQEEMFSNYIPNIPADDAPKAPQNDKRVFVLDESYSEISIPPPDFADYARDRDTDYPHIISVDEFMQDNQHYDKISLDYYREDDVVADQTDRPYDDHEEVLGVEWDEKFGFGSGDKNVVYVRNNELEIDFEISKDERSYTEVALGIKAPREQIGKFREDD